MPSLPLLGRPSATGVRRNTLFGGGTHIEDRKQKYAPARPAASALSAKAKTDEKTPFLLRKISKNHFPSPDFFLHFFPF